MRLLLLFCFGFILGCISIASGATDGCSMVINDWARTKITSAFLTNDPNPIKPGEAPSVYCNFTFQPPELYKDFFLFIEISLASVQPGVIEFTYPDGKKAEFLHRRGSAVSFKNFFVIRDWDIQHALTYMKLSLVGYVTRGDPIKLVQLIKGKSVEVKDSNEAWYYFDGRFRLRSFWIKADFLEGEGKYKFPLFYRPIGHVYTDLKGYEFQKGGQKKKGSSSVNLSTIILVVLSAISIGIIGFLVFKLRRKNLSSNNQQSTNAEQTALRTAEQPVDKAADSKL